MATKGCLVDFSQPAESVLQTPGLMGPPVNMWGGATGYVTCMALCKQTKGCVAIDIVPPGKTRFQKSNCALFSSTCENPTNENSIHLAWEGYGGPAYEGICNEEPGGNNWWRPEAVETTEEEAETDTTEDDTETDIETTEEETEAEEEPETEDVSVSADCTTTKPDHKTWTQSRCQERCGNPTQCLSNEKACTKWCTSACPCGGV